MRLPSVRSHLALRIALLFALGTAALAAVRAASGQSPAAPSVPDAAAPAGGGVSGRVIDAATGEPLGDAFVLLLPVPEGVLPGGAANAPASIAQGRRVRTDSAGRYRFERVAAGSYRLHVSRIGYAAAALDVTVDGTSPDVGVGLVVAPVTLTAVRIDAHAPADPRRSLTRIDDGPDRGRVAAARARQAAYASTDVRELTEADVGEAVTLAESDLFRGLHRAPGVSTRDEWSAELWTRGGRADQTRVLFDGMPLFAPYHAYGTLTAVMPEAVGAAFLHPGVRPASLGEGSAGVLDLRSAPGRAGHSLGGRGEVGIASARVALDGGAGRLAWTAGVRRSYMDGLSAIPTPANHGHAVYLFPYSFADGFARADYSLGGGRTLALSGTATGDRDREGGEFGLQDYGGGRWGNRAARLTFATPLATRLGALRASQTVGASSFAFRQKGGYACQVALNCDPSVLYYDAPIGPDSHSGVQYLVARGELAPATDSGAAAPWSVGYEVNAQRTRFAGRPDFYSANTSVEFTTDTIGPPRAPIPDTTMDGRVRVAALWGTRRWTPAPALVVETGLRIEHATIDGRGASVLPAPRLSLRYDLGSTTRLSAAAGRSIQYTQALPRVGIGAATRFYPAALWLTARADVPPLTTDLVTAGAEHWLGHDWLASANAYWRHTAGVATQDPTPGIAEGRRLYVAGRGAARGVELSARRLAGATTGSVSYSYGVSTLDAGGYQYPAPEDRTHAVDLAINHRFGPRWRLGAAVSASTGAPYTATELRAFERPANPDVEDSRYTFGAPGARRLPSAFLFGTEAEWTHRYAHWQLSAYGQLQSALAEYSPGSYRGSACFVREYGSPAVCEATLREHTFKVLPTVGLRFAF